MLQLWGEMKVSSKTGLSSQERDALTRIPQVHFRAHMPCTIIFFEISTKWLAACNQTFLVEHWQTFSFYLWPNLCSYYCLSLRIRNLAKSENIIFTNDFGRFFVKNIIFQFFFCISATWIRNPHWLLTTFSGSKISMCWYWAMGIGLIFFC